MPHKRRGWVKSEPSPRNVHTVAAAPVADVHHRALKLWIDGKVVRARSFRHALTLIHVHPTNHRPAEIHYTDADGHRRQIRTHTGRGPRLSGFVSSQGALWRGPEKYPADTLMRGKYAQSVGMYKPNYARKQGAS